MSRIFGGVIEPLNSRIVVMVLVIFFAVSCTGIAFIYAEQNRFCQYIQSNSLANKELKGTVEGYLPPYYIGIAEQQKVNEWLYRVIPLENEKLYLILEHPIWVVLLSPVLCYFALFLSLFCIYLSQRENAKILAIKQRYDVIEQWAKEVLAFGKVSSIKEQNSITSAINVIYQQLMQNQMQNIATDANMKASVLLDQETGIGNRAFFDNRLHAYLNEGDAQGIVLLIQFNGCDLVEHLYGQASSKALLSSFILIIEKRLESYQHSVIARRGDFELAVLLPRVFNQEAEKIASRILRNLQMTVLPVGINRDELVHIGISSISQRSEFFDVMAEADMALRSAQLQGPSQWFIYRVGELKNIKEKGSLQWRTLLNRALVKQSFVLFFQPVVACIDREILHHEVFAKLPNGDEKMISASIFIPMANKCGLTRAIDFSILDKVCQKLTRESDPKDYSINLSIDTLLFASFAEDFSQLMSDYLAITKYLIIEISEYQLVQHINKLIPIFSLLETLNIRLVVDKVGQSIVSANYINCLNLYGLKLHSSIVLNIHQRTENQVFIQSLMRLTKPKQLDVYALGIESKEEWQMLKKLEVRAGQGHLFTAPTEHVSSSANLVR